MRIAKNLGFLVLLLLILMIQANQNETHELQLKILVAQTRNVAFAMLQAREARQKWEEIYGIATWEGEVKCFQEGNYKNDKNSCPKIEEQ